MRVFRWLAAAGLVALAGCSQAAKAPEAAYNTDLPMNELMGHVVDPASFAYWRGAGTEVTEAGERDLSPTTPEGWKVVEDGAATLIEAGNAMLIPGRPREPVADWNRYTQAMIKQAIVAKAAAERQDKEAVFEEGAKLYQTCVACHAQFVIAPMEAEQ